MFQLLQPIWLSALAGLSVPVVIHLWNQRPGKTLRVGSTALVVENITSHKKSIRLTEILLLLLRCLLLACIAITLSVPIWRSAAGRSSKGWLLINKGGTAQAYKNFKPLIDSLLQAGLAFHYFEEGFATEKFENALQAGTDSNTVIASSYRRIIELLNEQVDASMPIYVFTDNYLRHFTGPRTAAALNLHWFTYAADTVPTQPVTDTSLLHITVYTHHYTNDVRYLQAALEAIRQFSKKSMVIKTVADTALLPANQDWLFWLADETPVIRAAKNILSYATGKPAPDASVILPNNKLMFDAVDLYKSIPEKDTADKSAAVLWKDGFGRSLLTAVQAPNATYYRLYTHFDPAWNELPWSDNFPQILYSLLYEADTKSTAEEAAMAIDSSQLMPLRSTTKEAAVKPIIFTETKLSGLFWIAILLLFFAERLLSFYHRKTTGNG